MIRNLKFFFIRILSTVLIFSAMPYSYSQSPMHIGLLDSHIEKQELSAVENILKSKHISHELISSTSKSASESLNRFTHIWYHRTDTLDFDAQETSLGSKLIKYVQNGGTLFLSMEAVPLLNKWHIESNPIQQQTDTVRDEGFGRPLGFHGFKSHPVFAGLLGGVYTSKQKNDHIVRKHGFFGSSVPKEGAVIGIQWTYITFTEQSKLLLEYNLGKGKIIAAGAYLYYAADNYNQDHLADFTDNLFGYTANKIKGIKSYYWDYAERKMTPSTFELGTLAVVPATPWQLPAPPLEMTQERASDNFYDLVGRKILWMGKMNGGADEIWMHPFMALRDFSAGIRIKGEDSVSWLKNYPVRTTITPAYLTRTYHIKSTTIKEIYTVSFGVPCGVAHYEIRGNDVSALTIQYASNLRYMWPYSHEATGSIRYEFNQNINGHIISGQKGELNTVVLYSARPQHQSSSAKPSANQVAVTSEFSVANNTNLNVYIMGSSKSLSDAIRTFSNAQQQLSHLYKQSNTYYNKLLSDHLMIITPDTVFNNGYKWALARTDQFLQTTPGIGTALMAGFGTTERGWNGRQSISGRPGYAWYFGRDGAWSAMAINAYGDFKMVKQALETFIRYQDITGKIYHELTSSGVAHYDAADATPLFVILAGHYLKYSGDVAFIKANWSAIKKAVAYCNSTDTDGDGLIENTNVGHGWIEGGALFGTHTEFYLAGCWAATLEAAAYMARSIGLPKEKEVFMLQAAIVKRIIDKDFWDPKQQFFYNGKMQDGTYMQDATVLATVPVYLNTVTDTAKMKKVSARLSSKYFSTNWGIRILEDSSSKYKPASYHAGMVWPLYGGWAALSEFKTGDNRSGFQHIMNNLLIYRTWGLGSIEETLNGDTYIPNGVCSHQCWSETMVLQPSIEGMLGLEPDALQNEIAMAPYFPWHWKYCTVSNISMAQTRMNLKMSRDSLQTTYHVLSNKAVKLQFAPYFPFNTTVTGVLINGKVMPYKTVAAKEGLQVRIEQALMAGTSTIIIKHSGGIGALPVVYYPQPGDSSKGLQIIDEKCSTGSYEITVQGNAAAEKEIGIFTRQKIRSVENGVISNTEDNKVFIKVSLPGFTADNYVNTTVKINYE